MDVYHDDDDNKCKWIVVCVSDVIILPLFFYNQGFGTRYGRDTYMGFSVRSNPEDSATAATTAFGM
jgi:hypothetical protein